MYAFGVVSVLAKVVLGFSLSGAVFHGMMFQNTLQGPYSDMSATGAKILEHWVQHGSVQIKQNFIRLTPDKPSKTGSLYNTQIAPTEDFTILLRFRISGSSEQLFGDGVAFWFTDAQNFVLGSIMGSTESFTGFGVLFDTFQNDPGHKDVRVIASDGTEPILSHKLNRFPGCDAKFRRWESSKDFNVDQETAIKLSFLSKNNMLVLEIDALGTGTFQRCVEASLTKYLPRDNLWRGRAHIALSATTGALHDNHDLLELIVTSAEHFDRLMEVHEEMNTEPTVVIPLDENVTIDQVGEHVNYLSSDVKGIDDRLTKLHHEIEFELEKVAHKLESLIESLAAQEKKLEMRVVELERRTEQSLKSTLDSRIATLEQQVNTQISITAQATKTAIVGSKADTDSHRNWFYVFVIIVMGGFAYFGFTLFRVNRRLNKDAHFL